MRKPVIVDAPYPTADDIAEIFHIGKARMRRLTAFANQILESSPDRPSKTMPISRARTKKRVSRPLARRKRQARKQG